jgi:hypothetical protein
MPEAVSSLFVFSGYAKGGEVSHSLTPPPHHPILYFYSLFFVALSLCDLLTASGLFD